MHQIAAAAECDHLRNLGSGIAQIAKMAGIDRADHNAGRLSILRREVLIVNPVNAQCAFLHDAFVSIELARAVRASPGAQLTADANRLVDQHDAIFGALIGGAGRAYGDASWFIAM